MTEFEQATVLDLNTVGHGTACLSRSVARCGPFMHYQPKLFMDMTPSLAFADEKSLVVRRRDTTHRFLAEPTSVNFGGKVHGGALMKWIDEVAFACAAMWSGCYCVTVSVGNIRFRRPILVGHVVELHARVVATGRTSMHIHVSVRAGDPKTGDLELTTDCLMVFVAVDAGGKTTPVPSFTASSDEERRLAKYAMDVKAALDALVELKPDEVVAGRV